MLYQLITLARLNAVSLMKISVSEYGVYYLSTSYGGLRVLASVKYLPFVEATQR